MNDQGPNTAGKDTQQPIPEGEVAGAPAPNDDPPADALLTSALAGITANLVAFGNELGEAAQLFREIQAIDGGRVGCMMALKAVIDFCDSMGVEQERRHPLLKLFVALQSAEAGAVDPLLKVSPRPNAPPLTVAEKWQRGCLAGAMEALIRGGFKPDDAARWVANRSRKMMAAGRVKTDLWKAVKSWRVAASGGDPTQDQDACAYRVACELLETGVGVGQQGAEVLVEKAAAEGTIQETPPLS